MFLQKGREPTDGRREGRGGEGDEKRVEVRDTHGPRPHDVIFMHCKYGLIKIKVKKGRSAIVRIFKGTDQCQAVNTLHAA